MTHWTTLLPIGVGFIWAALCVWFTWNDGKNSYGHRPHSYWKSRLQVSLFLWTVPMIFFLAIYGGIVWW